MTHMEPSFFKVSTAAIFSLSIITNCTVNNHQGAQIILFFPYLGGNIKNFGCATNRTGGVHHARVC